MTIAINPADIKVVDITGAYDLLRPTLTDPAIAEQQGIEQIQAALTKVGYSKATHTSAFIKTHAKSVAEGKFPPVTAATANEISKKIYEMITGNPVTDAEIEAGEAAAPATVDSSSNDAPQTAEVTAPTPVTPGAFTPTVVDSLAVAHDNIRNAIGATLETLSNKKITKAEAIVKAFVKAEARIAQGEAALETGRKKLDLLTAQDFDAATAIEIPTLDSFQTSGIVELRWSPQDLIGPNAILTSLPGGSESAQPFNAVLDALKKAETKATSYNRALNELKLKIRKATPKERIKMAGEDGQPGFDVVMRTASDIFGDKAFGIPSTLLSFEVPTFDWHGERPKDVPEIDQTFLFMGKVVTNALDAISENKIPWLHGDSGCGKTAFWQQIAARLGLPFYRVNLDSGVTRSDLIGRTTLKPGPNGNTVTEFSEGILVRALQQACILLFDEMDCGDADLFPILQPVLEGEGLRILEDGGRKVDQHPYCRIVVTGNTNGLGSASGAYNNVNELSAATRNRIHKWMKMPYLPESQELQVVLMRNPTADPDFAKKLVQLANQARDAYSKAESGQIVSTRNVEEATRFHAKFAPLLSDSDELTRWVLETTILESCDDKSRNTLSAMITQIFV